MVIRVLERDDLCEGCGQAAEYVVYFRKRKNFRYLCHGCIRPMMDEYDKAPKYIADCPNCRCKFGVN